ncbi:YheU family protein [Marinomonas sp.]|nr:YheU family protein [Marinomonas sp.]MDB4837292.1 YheU family protein [Marinomonas sp.]
MDTLIPHNSLSVEVLERILDDLVTRDGTDYGNYDLSIEQKRAQALQSLESGEAVLLFDTESETIKMVLKDALANYDFM